MTVWEQENNLNCDGDGAWRVLADFGNFLAGSYAMMSQGLEVFVNGQG